MRFEQWKPQGVTQCLISSSRNLIGLMEDGQTVLKYPLYKTEDAMDCLREEADRYGRLAPHTNLVTYKGFSEDGLLLEYCQRGELHDLIQTADGLTADQKKTIGIEIVSGVMHLHDQDYIHCDLNVHNILLTSDMVAKIGDLQGQLYRHDGSVELETMSQENPKSRHPFAGDDEFSPRTDIFALGTLLYHLWHGHPPFPELNEHTQADEIKARYSRREYPSDIDQSTAIDEIIVKCWTSSYKNASELLEDIETPGNTTPLWSIWASVSEMLKRATSIVYRDTA
ncbi:hypothetical protein WHR41_02646 [Cladosporium halotolerans]|uniref:Protein kinase domain-containing protein n=1 Tax=Cladosporium halotolerans TaxID=1052096 RepID=A0AB34KZ84_9PEZI